MDEFELATLGGGCFWCLEAVYQRVKGVKKVVSGHSGGHLNNPTMKDVYAGNTGHAEVVQVSFDKNSVSYKEILEIFFVMHDPTTLNRQGYDIGDEYRSVIFYHNDKQKEIAKDMKDNFAKKLWSNPIVTEIKPFDKFWPADEDQQNFYNNNPYAGYCQVIINPKIQKLRKEFASKFLA